MAKKEEVSNAVVPFSNSSEVALPPELAAQLAEDAKSTASTERPAVGRIGLKAGIITYEGDPVKGNKLRIVILAKSYLNIFYDGPYDENQIRNPRCFALCEEDPEETDVGMHPHENVIEPIHPQCDGCPNMKWGTSGGGRRGKACKETRRLVVMPEGALESPEDVASAELALLRLPVTSVKVWGSFVNTLAATTNLPHYAVVAELSTEPDLKTQFKLVLTPVSRIASPELLQAVMAKRTEARRIAMLPYDEDEGADGEQFQQPPASGPAEHSAQNAKDGKY